MARESLIRETLTVDAGTTEDSTTVTGNFLPAHVGMTVRGTGIPNVALGVAQTTVLSVTEGVSAVLSRAATATGSPTLTLVGETYSDDLTGLTGAGGGGDITDPLDIPDCALWLDASQLALADNDPVATWPDLSGNGFDAEGGALGKVITVAITGASSGSWNADFGGGSNQFSVAWNISAADLQTAIEGGDLYAPGDVTVGLSGQVYTITFDPSFGQLPSLIATQDSLDVEPVAAVVRPALAPPIYKVAAQNGLGGVRFLDENGSDGPTRQLRFSALSMLTGAPAYTVGFVLVNRSQGFGEEDIFWATSPNTDGNGRPRRLHVGMDTSSDYFECYAGNDDDVDEGFIGPQIGPGTNSGMVGAFAALCLVDLVNLRSIVETNEPNGTVTTGNNSAPLTAGPFPATDPYAMGIGGDNLGYYSLYPLQDCDICELVVYPRALNAKERRQLREYLSSKWQTS